MVYTSDTEANFSSSDFSLSASEHRESLYVLVLNQEMRSLKM